MTANNRPPNAPLDLWITCNDVQRKWLLDEHAKEQRIGRIRGRIQARKDADAQQDNDSQRNRGMQ